MFWVLVLKVMIFNILINKTKKCYINIITSFYSAVYQTLGDLILPLHQFLSMKMKPIIYWIALENYPI